MGITSELQRAICQLKEGKEEGFSVVYSNTYDYVYSKAKYLMKSEEDALDLTQETYVQAYKGISDLKDPENIYAWLGGIVYRQGMKIFNKKKDVLVDEEQNYIFEDTVSKEATPEESAEQDATKQIVRDFIEELPELQKVAVLAFYYDDMKISEIAEMCDCSSNTIKSRLNYAKKFLKDKVVAHEKKNRYKLYSVTPAIMYMVLKDMFDSEEYRMPSHAVQEVYGLVCGKVQIKPSTIPSTKAGMKTVAEAAVKTGVSSLGAKAAIVITGVVLTVGVGTAVIGNISKNNDNVTEMYSERESEDLANDREDTPMEQLKNKKEVENNSEVVYNEDIPMEGRYAYADYSASITNVRISDEWNAVYDIELSMEGNEYRRAEKVNITDATKVDGRTEIDAVSDIGNRWFGNLRYMEDGSIIMNISVEESDSGVYDLAEPGLTILTKAAADGLAANSVPEEGIYRYSPGEDSEYTVEISGIEENEEFGITVNMNLGYVAHGGNKVEGMVPEEMVCSANGIYTFSGQTGWNAIMWGYMYFTDDGSLCISYTCDNTEDIFWDGFGEGTNAPLILKK